MYADQNLMARLLLLAIFVILACTSALRTRTATVAPTPRKAVTPIRELIELPERVRSTNDNTVVRKLTKLLEEPQQPRPVHRRKCTVTEILHAHAERNTARINHHAQSFYGHGGLGVRSQLPGALF